MYLGKTADVIECIAKSLFEQVKNMTAEDFAIYVLDARLKKNQWGGVHAAGGNVMRCANLNSRQRSSETDM